MDRGQHYFMLHKYSHFFFFRYLHLFNFGWPRKLILLQMPYQIISFWAEMLENHGKLTFSQLLQEGTEAYGHQTWEWDDVAMDW